MLALHVHRPRQRTAKGQTIVTTVSQHAGRRPEASMLVDVDRLVRAYYQERPDPSVPG
jgi:hypothetical protein